MTSPVAHTRPHLISGPAAKATRARMVVSPLLALGRVVLK